MIKSIFKEIIIILLLLIIIIVLLGILFYDYIPSGKTVPFKVDEYALEPDIQVELDKELNNDTSEEIVKTYQVDAMDLAGYEKTNEYNKGKINPFAGYSNKVEEENTNSNTNSNNSNSGGNNNTENSSGGNFLNTVGK